MSERRQGSEETEGRRRRSNGERFSAARGIGSRRMARVEHDGCICILLFFLYYYLIILLILKSLCLIVNLAEPRLSYMYYFTIYYFYLSKNCVIYQSPAT